MMRKLLRAVVLLGTTVSLYLSVQLLLQPVNYSTQDQATFQINNIRKHSNSRSKHNLNSGPTHPSSTQNETTKTTSQSWPFAVIHIGPHKTGTSSIQRALLDNNNVLEEDNYLQPYQHIDEIGTCKGPKLVADFAFCLQGQHARFPCPEGLVNGSYIPFFSEAVSKRRNLLLSSEEFHNSHVDVAALQSMLKEYGPHRTKIINVYRHLHEWILSMYGQVNKYSSRAVSITAWFTHATWTRYLSNIHAHELYKEIGELQVMDFHDQSEELVERFICHELQPPAPKTCQRIQALEGHRQWNKAPNIDYHRIVQSAGLKLNPNERMRWAQRAQHWFENEQNASLSIYPQVCLDDFRWDLLVQSTIDYELLMRPYLKGGGYGATIKTAVEGSRSKFCSVTVRAALADEVWIEYLNDMKNRIIQRRASKSTSSQLS